MEDGWMAQLNTEDTIYLSMNLNVQALGRKREKGGKI